MTAVKIEYKLPPPGDTTVYNYYWNADYKPQPGLKPYTACQPANKGSLAPINASRTAPPPYQEGKWPIWTGTAWSLMDDHRQEKGYVNGQPTEIKDLGPYPAGWSATPPPPTAAEIKAQKEAELKGKLALLDIESIRALRAVAEGTATQADHDKLASLETQAAGYRAELAAL